MEMLFRKVGTDLGEPKEARFFAWFCCVLWTCSWEEHAFFVFFIEIVEQICNGEPWGNC